MLNIINILHILICFNIGGDRLTYRKLIKFGNSSLVVTMPRDWLNKNNLDKGAIVQVNEHQNDLILSPETKVIKDEPKEITISANKKLVTLYDMIVSSYINNYDTIIIVGDKLKDISGDLRTIIHGFVGLEIMEQTSSRIVAKDILEVKDISIVSLIRRVDNITRSMILDTKECIKGKDTSKHVIDRDKDVNRLVMLIYKLVLNALEKPMVAKSLEVNNRELLYLFNVAEKVEKIADQVKRICKYTTLIDKKVDRKEILNLFEMLEKQYLSAIKAYYTKDYKLADEVLIRKKDLINICEAFLLNNRDIMATKMVEKMISMNTFSSFVARSVFHGGG